MTLQAFELRRIIATSEPPELVIEDVLHELVEHVRDRAAGIDWTSFRLQVCDPGTAALGGHLAVEAHLRADVPPPPRWLVRDDDDDVLRIVDRD